MNRLIMIQRFVEDFRVKLEMSPLWCEPGKIHDVILDELLFKHIVQPQLPA